MEIPHEGTSRSPAWPVSHRVAEPVPALDQPAIPPAPERDQRAKAAAVAVIGDDLRRATMAKSVRGTRCQKWPIGCRHPVDRGPPRQSETSDDPSGVRGPASSPAAYGPFDDDGFRAFLGRSGAGLVPLSPRSKLTKTRHSLHLHLSLRADPPALCGGEALANPEGEDPGCVTLSKRGRPRRRPFGESGDEQYAEQCQHERRGESSGQHRRKATGRNGMYPLEVTRDPPTGIERGE
jgi:hypothetical protein